MKIIFLPLKNRCMFWTRKRKRIKNLFVNKIYNAIVKNWMPERIEAKCKHIALILPQEQHDQYTNWQINNQNKFQGEIDISTKIHRHRRNIYFFMSILCDTANIESIDSNNNNHFQMNWAVAFEEYRLCKNSWLEAFIWKFHRLHNFHFIYHIYFGFFFGGQVLSVCTLRLP